MNLPLTVHFYYDTYDPVNTYPDPQKSHGSFNYKKIIAMSNGRTIHQTTLFNFRGYLMSDEFF
jgi:hypothetical protein